MSACKSECDCFSFINEWGCEEHAHDCHSRQECGYGDGGYCDLHFEEQAQAHSYLRGTPRYTLLANPDEGPEYRADMRDAGRGHLVRS